MSPMSRTEMVSLRDLLSRLTADSAPELARPLPDGRVMCLACGHRCKIPEGRGGVCGVRSVKGGVLKRPRGYVGTAACDPIEKKPFFHAYPGRDALTFGMLGCDLHCGYCQNWFTSQALRDDEAIAPPRQVSPERLVEAARECGAAVLASSYNEPLITADWAVEVFRCARAAGLACGFISNGNGTPEVLEFLRPHVDLYKVDLKSFRDEAYRQLGGHLRNVTATIRRLKELEYWVEVVTLVIPGFNDSESELRQIAEFLAGVDPGIPWHVTAFHPDYKMTDRGRTPAETLIRAYDLGREAGLRFVYPGNIPGAVGDRESTFCPGCGALLIRRRGFLVTENRMQGSRCPDCAERIPGVWEERPPPRTVGLGFPKPVVL
jgi:pyruvate formate lyase activating enzyme